MVWFLCKIIETLVWTRLSYSILHKSTPPPPTLSFIYMMSYNIKDQHLMGEDNVKKIVYLVLFLYLFFVLFTMILKVIWRSELSIKREYR